MQVNCEISYELKDDIVYIGFGHQSSSSVNVLTLEMVDVLNNYIEKINSNKSIKGLIFHSHKDKCFLAGADINAIANIESEVDGEQKSKMGQKLFNKIDDLKIPTIAAINGVALGGGLELALSCKSIVVSTDKSTILGLPEVKLGLLPGFGGTYRLPVKIGLIAALDLILTGKTVDFKKALKLKLAQGAYPKERLLELALNHLTKNKFQYKTSVIKDNIMTKKIILQKAREKVINTTKGFYHAPLKILDTMELALNKNRDNCMSIESQSFGELAVTEQSKNLQHIFFLTEKSKKYKDDNNVKIFPIKRAAVLGAGTMGGGICHLLAKEKLYPILKDIKRESLELGLKQCRKNFEHSVKRKKLTNYQMESLISSISVVQDYTGFKRVDLLIEAVVEDLQIKKLVLSETEENLKDDAIITTNTSSLCVSEIAKALKNPERFAGLHFFNPVNRMPLVEIVSHETTSPEILKTLHYFIKNTGKTPIVVKDSPGFLVNRILGPFINEACYMLNMGVDAQDIDKACLDFGMPMGPLALLDQIGIDIACKVSKSLYQGLGERMTPSAVFQSMVDNNFLGKKTSIGFYKYEEKVQINPKLNKILDLDNKKTLSSKEIQDSIFLSMINEAARVLEDSIVKTANDVDLGLIYGIGFPPFRGGLLRYADTLGIKYIVEKLNKLSNIENGHRFSPCSYLRDLALKNGSFYGP